MRVVKPQALLFQCAPTQRGSVAEMGLSVGVGFRLSDPRILKHEAAVWHAAANTPASVPLHELARPKRFAEWLLVGHTLCEFDSAHLSTRMDWTAEVRLHQNRKALSAMAEVTRHADGRCWAKLLADHSQTAKGAGGRNPVGHPGQNAPLQRLGWTGARDEALAGMGPIDSRWADCMQWAPTFASSVEDMAKDGGRMGWPADTDLRYFQQAPPDQWASTTVWPSSAAYRLSGFGPNGVGAAGALPALSVSLVLRRKDAVAAECITLAQQTVWFLPDADIGVMWWHGAAPLHHVLDDSLALAVAALQPVGAEVSPQRLLQLAERRTLLTGIDYLAQCDSHLMPPPSAGWTWEQIRSVEEAPQEGCHAASYEALQEQVAQQMAEFVNQAHAHTRQPTEGTPALTAMPKDSTTTTALSCDWRTRLQAAPERVLRQQTLRHQDLRGLSLHGWLWEDIRLEHCTLDQSQLEECEFSQVQLVDCQLNGVQWRQVNWTDGGLQRCVVQHSAWVGVNLKGVHWDHSQMADSQFHAAQWEAVQLTDCSVSAGHWEQLTLHSVTAQHLVTHGAWRWTNVFSSSLALLECQLVNTQFSRCKFDKFSAVETKLDGSSWEHCRLCSISFVKGSSLRHSVWRDCELAQACWIDLQAEGIDLDHCTFKQLSAQSLLAPHSRWTYTVLTGANLLNASLAGSLLEYSALRGATLVGAELCNSAARHCNLIQADLTDSTLPNPGAWHSNLEGRCITTPRRTS